MWSKIIPAIFGAIPGLLKLISAFKGKKEVEPGELDAKAANEINELEAWRAAANKEASDATD